MVLRAPVLPVEKRLDDPSIAPSTPLWHYIDPWQIYWPSGANEPIVSTDAFHSEEISAELSDTTTLKEARAAQPGCGIAELIASDVRAAVDGNGVAMIIARDPNRAAHGLMYRGPQMAGSNTSSQAKFLRSRARLLPQF